MIKIIAATSSNGVIGLSASNSIPFHYPIDMQHFKKMTTGNIVVMGRKTFESIGKPLPNRENIVISKFGKELGQLNIPEIKTFGNIENFFENEKLIIRDTPKDIWFIGGASIYQEGMEYADEIHLTITPDKIIDKDTIKFPWINPLIFSVNSIKQLSNLQYIIYKKL